MIMKNAAILLWLLSNLLSMRTQGQERTCTETCNNGYNHNYLECIEDMINVGSLFDKFGVSVFGGDTKVSLSEERKIGDEALREAKGKYKIITTGEKYQRVNEILQRLTYKVQKPQGYTFSIHLLESDVINAWTCGGQIFITTAIYDFCISKDEIACIIGHEISHNLLGHLNFRMKKMKIAGEWGVAGQLAAVLGTIATAAFGQEDEAHSDLLGVDLAKAAGYRSCEAIHLWERMAEKQGSFDGLTNFLSSHPHPEKRSVCIKNHLQRRYSINCEQ